MFFNLRKPMKSKFFLAIRGPLFRCFYMLDFFKKTLKKVDENPSKVFKKQVTNNARKKYSKKCQKRCQNRALKTLFYKCKNRVSLHRGRCFAMSFLYFFRLFFMSMLVLHHETAKSDVPDSKMTLNRSGFFHFFPRGWPKGPKGPI